jgi:hypothetical protein
MVPVAKNITKKHGRSHTTEYRTWERMKKRCYNKNDISYQYYGGRGIAICDRWKYSFIYFYTDMGNKPEGRELDRIDNDGDYTPENCRWATRRQQANNKSNSRRLTFKGQTFTIAQWARRTEVKEKTIWWRVKNGWSTERALTT